MEKMNLNKVSVGKMQVSKTVHGALPVNLFLRRLGGEVGMKIYVIIIPTLL